MKDKKNVKIKDLIDNKNYIIEALVTKITVGKIKDRNSKFLSLILSDGDGFIDAKLWDANEKNLEELKTGRVYKFDVFSSLYKNQLQLRIKDYLWLKNANLDDFLVKANINPEKEYNFIFETISNFKNKIYKDVLFAVLKKHGVKFKEWAAAKTFHHNVKYGLLWHTASMLKVAKSFSRIYSDKIIDFELLYAGIILHDMGKVIEIKSNIELDYTLEGSLLGHISIMNAELLLIASIIGIESNNYYLTLLRHMVLGSHGKLEYGSPVLPHLIETEILSYIDDLDAKIFIISSEYEKINNDEKTPLIFSLNQRWFYKHK